MKNFDAVFASDLEPQRIEFQVQGRDCWIELRPMDQSACDRFKGTGVTYRMVNERGETRQEIDQVDIELRNRYLVAHTVVGGEIWRQNRTDKGVLWQQDIFLNTPSARMQQIERMGLTQGFWEWLLEKCEEANAPQVDAKAAKN